MCAANREIIFQCMTKNKKWVYIISGITLILVAGVGIILHNTKEYDQETAKKCIGYDPNWPLLTDCYGMVSTSQAFDIKGYSLVDHIHNYELAEVDNINQYKYQEGKIYVKNREPFNCSPVDKNGQEQFCHNLFQNGQIRTNYYDSVSDIPTYLIIDSKSGEVQAFQDTAQVPENEQNYFNQIKDK